MLKMCKRFVAVYLTLLLLFCSAIPAQAAAGDYSVQVQNNTVLFIRDGKIAGRYAVTDPSLTLMTNSGRLLVCFYNSQNQYKYITLGKQSSLSLSGTMKTLTLSSSLSSSTKITVASTASVSNMQVSSSSNVAIQGKVATLAVSSAANVTVARNAAVTTARLSSSKAKLTASAGSKVSSVLAVSKTSVSGSGIGTLKIGNAATVSSSSSSLKISASTIYADYGERLRDLLDDLSGNITATVGGSRVSGTVTWVSPNSTILKKSGNYQYQFNSTNHKYGSKRGTVRILVDDYGDDYDDDLDLDIDSFTVSSSTKRLSSYTSKLNSHVTAYNSDGDRVRGEAEWVLGNTRLDDTGNYPFIFIANSSRYGRVRDKIKIYVDDDYDDDDDDDDDEIRLETDSFHAEYRDRLRDYQDELEDNVKAYNRSGKRVYGDVRWEDKDERITKDGYYDFTFYPDDGDYDDKDGRIKIYAD